MKTSLTSKNWVRGKTPAILERIHEVDVNIALFDRDISAISKEIAFLIQRDIELRSCGSIDTMVNAISDSKDLEGCETIKGDIKDLIHLFGDISGAKEVRIFLATVKNSMCRKFHTDINDLRMLCTYSGPGTLWVREDDWGSAALEAYEESEDGVIDERHVEQAETGSVVLLKGAIYPKEGAKAILHRSPTIEENVDKRLLLRVDTDAFLNF